MIRKFSCHNYRNIDADGLTFDKINILVGPNNSGKSNFIRAITFYSNLLKHPGDGGLKTAFLNGVKRGGWDHIRNKAMREDAPVSLQWQMDLDDRLIDFNFSFIAAKKVEDCHIVSETMSDAIDRGYSNPFNYFTCHERNVGKGYISSAVDIGETNSRIYFDLDSTEVFCRQYKDILLSDSAIYGSNVREKLMVLLEKLESKFLGMRSYSSARINIEEMRKPLDPVTKENTLLADASNFIAVFNQYKSESLQWRRLFLEKMQELDSEITDLDIVIKYDKFGFFIEKENKITLDFSDVSEGTLKALVMNLLLNMPQERENFLLAIDEPENNLHPAWQKVIGRWIQESTAFEQCFISTHSPDFLDTFTEYFKQGYVSVFVFDGMNNIRRVTFDMLKEALGDWELGDLYRTNDPALGGWPW